MISHLLKFIWHETLLELRRERLISVTTVSTVAVLLVLLGANLLFVLNLRVWADRAAKEVEVFAYFRKDLSRDGAEQLTKELSGWPEVSRVEFVTREQLWAYFSTKVVDAGKLRGLDASTFSDSAKLQIKDPAHVPEVAKKLEETQGVESVIPGSKEGTDSSRVGKFIRDVVRFKQLTQWIGVIVALLVAVVGMFVVHNTIRLATHARWREIYIMQLVGATRALIASPFLLQGAIHGAIGAALASCILVPLHMYLGAVVVQSGKDFLRLQPDAALFPFTVFLVLGGVVLGLLGSGLSIRRTLRHKPEWES